MTEMTEMFVFENCHFRHFRHFRILDLAFAKVLIKSMKNDESEVYKNISLKNLVGYN